MTNHIWQLSASDIVQRVRDKSLSATDVCKAAMQRMEAVNHEINAVVQHTYDDAMTAAKAVDEKVARGEDIGSLAGVPVTVKVNVDQAGYATTNGTRILSETIAKEDNPVVANLKAAGALIVGRTNTPAFSLRWFTRNQFHGHTRNPRNSSITPGGSSGGAAASVASGIAAIGHGTDIGGSIRYPAYACGIQGLRPSLGRVPAVNFSAKDRHIGAQLMAVSGPMARSIADLRLALDAMARQDLRDPWWTAPPSAPIDGPKRAALAIAPDDLEVAPEVVRALKDAAARLIDDGWEVVEASPPPMRMPAYLMTRLWIAEFRRAALSMLTEEGDPDALFVFERLEADGPPPDLEEIMDALQTRVTLMRAWNLFLAEYPVLLCPVSGALPFPDQEDVSSPDAFLRVLEAQLTQLSVPFLGLPALSVFTGLAKDDVPNGVQLIGGRFSEELLLDAGEAIESRSPAITIATPNS